MKHFLTLFEVSTEEIRSLLRLAADLKAKLARGERPALLAGRVMGLVFEKPSLRTRASFEAGMAQLGGNSIFFSSSDGAIGKRETVPDFARTLSEFVDVAVLRVFEHRTVEEFAQYASVPVINGLSDLAHPCQALGDLLTMQEFLGEDLTGRTLTYVGDGNNVARSLALACARMKIRFRLTAPTSYQLEEAFLDRLRKLEPGADLRQTDRPQEAVKEADVIYTDVWTSMGQEAESAKRLKDFKGFQIDRALLDKAPPTCRFMHCLPARRGEEVSAEIMEDPRSVVFPQAGNRMHAQKALVLHLITQAHM